MATREDIKNVMAFMACSFPNYHPILDGQVNAVDVLLNLLGDLPVETLQVAVQACCAEPGRAFAPSAGEIRGMAVQLHAQAACLPTAAEAWGVIEQCWHLTSDGRQALLDKQHPLFSKALHCMGGLSVIGMSENPPAERARFLQFYDELREQTLNDAAMLPQVADYIESAKLVDGGIKTLSDKLSRPRLEKNTP